MNGLKADSDQDLKRPHSEWHERLMSALKDRKVLAEISQAARREIVSDQYLSRQSKMRQAGEDDE